PSDALSFPAVPSGRAVTGRCNLLDLNGTDSPFLILQVTLWPAYWTLIGPRLFILVRPSSSGTHACGLLSHDPSIANSETSVVMPCAVLISSGMTSILTRRLS